MASVSTPLPPHLLSPLSRHISLLQSFLNPLPRSLLLISPDPHLLHLLLLHLFPQATFHHASLPLPASPSSPFVLVDLHLLSRPPASILSLFASTEIVLGTASSRAIPPSLLRSGRFDSHIHLPPLPPPYTTLFSHLTHLPSPSPFPRPPHVKFSDLGGYHAAKRQLIRLGTPPPSNFPLSLPRGALLLGPPESGKSALLCAIAAHYNQYSAIHCPVHTLLNRYVGESEKRMRQVFAHARHVRPCMVLLDDLDVLFRERDEELSLSSRLVGCLLAELDGIVGGNDHVIVVGCARRREDVDTALRRVGRLEVEIELQKPNEEERAEILKTCMKGMKMEAQGMWTIAAKWTEGLFAGGLKKACREAGMLAVEKGLNTISEACLREAVEEVMKERNLWGKQEG